MADTLLVSPTPAGTTYAGPNSPQLDSRLTEHVLAIKEVGQAISIVKSLKEENVDRETRNARITRKIDSERPFNQDSLKADGLGWKNNFSTKVLATLADKVVPRPVVAIRRMRYLTASRLPDHFPGAAEKTTTFREEVTKTCRAREGWEELITELAHEDVLFGFAGLGWLSRYTWMPEVFRQSHMLLSQGTKHAAKTAPLVAFRKNYLLHELFELVRDRSAAEAAGWNVEEVINSINNAVPSNMRSRESDSYRIYADLIREASVLTSFTGSKSVDVWHVLVAEVDGYVSHIAFDAVSEKEVFRKDKQFAQMSDVLAVFSYQFGNGTVHSSKGIGRELYALAGVIDRARNEVVDRLNLSGKALFLCNEKDIRRFRMSVVGAAILVSNVYEVQQAKIDGNIEPFFELDKFMTNVLDNIAGSTSPQIFNGERVTKAAIELFASRDEEKRDAILERWLGQFARAMSTIQRRLCDPDTVDQDAKDLQKRLLQVMSPEEMEYLRNQPAVETVQDYTEREAQLIALIAQENQGNPLFNQRKLKSRQLTAMVDADFANDVLLPENDPTERAEQGRQQQLELEVIKTGQSVAVSPRDNHSVHIDVIRVAVSAILPDAVNNPAVDPVLHSLAAHAEAHVAMAEQTGNGKDIAQQKMWVTQFIRTLQQLDAANQQSAATQMNAPPGGPPPLQ